MSDKKVLKNLTILFRWWWWLVFWSNTIF